MGARAQHTPAYRRFCALLRSWRGEAELTQRELAARLGKPHSYVHKAEVADRRVDALEFIAWCDACEVDPAEALQAIRIEVPQLRAKRR